jgi:hypothetical protein
MTREKLTGPPRTTTRFERTAENRTHFSRKGTKA